jgi:hypothetical protein
VLQHETLWLKREEEKREDEKLKRNNGNFSLQNPKPSNHCD